MIIAEHNFNTEAAALKKLQDDKAKWEAEISGKDVKDPADGTTDKALDWPKLVAEAKEPYDRVKKKIDFYT